MPNISYDGQSFLVDGRRVWLVSGAIHYARVPRELWRRRIRAAREAGLNCIETYVFWNAHEAEPNKFNFEGQNDLRAFVEMIGEEGLYCWLRPGPYVCAEWDFGGLPPWLHRLEETKKTGPLRLRQNSSLFLEASSRYLGAVMEQVRDLQMTVPVEGRKAKLDGGARPGQPAGGFRKVAGGPIIMMQAENEWFSANPDAGENYLREIVRYLRENGCEVPINSCNQLWQRVDGTIDTWNASSHLPTDLRQLGVVQPDAPRIVSEYWTGWFDQWNGPHGDAVDADKHLYRLASIFASGAMANLFVFHGGTNFGFAGGRTVNGPDCFTTTSYDYDAPLLEAGGRGEKYTTTKRICTFASHFGSIFAHLGSSGRHAAITPDERDHAPSVLHLTGSQGSAVFVLRGQGSKAEEVNVMLPNGLSLPVSLGDESAAWLLLDANLAGAAQLNYTNLRPWAMLERKMLVLFGPAGSKGLLSLDDTQYELTVPDAASPLIEQHEDLTVVVCSTEQIDAAYLFDGGLAIGSSGLDDSGQPLPRKGWDHITRVDLDGAVTQTKGSPIRKPPAPKLGAWTAATLDSFVDGSSERYQKIDGPQSLEQLRCDYGYGWYKIAVGKTAKPGALFAPHSGDRLHVYADGKPQGILGEGPGANPGPTEMSLAGDVVVLADNLGRFNFGQQLGEQKGLLDHLSYVKPVKLPKPETLTERPADPFTVSDLVYHHRRGEQAPATALQWEIKPANRKPMILEIHDLPHDAVVVANDQPLAFYSHFASAGRLRVTLDPASEHFTGGQNKLKLCFSVPLGKDFDASSYVSLYQTSGAATSRGQWSFAPMAMPADDAFEKAPKQPTPQPTWFRTSFNTGVDRVPMFFEPKGMSKGQIYLNGHNVGRYFVADPDGKPVPPQEQYYLPEPWLNLEGPNELTVFDEHGCHPGKARLVFNAMGPHN